MKLVRLVGVAVAVSALVFAACSKSDASGPHSDTGMPANLDLSKLSPEALSAKAKTVFDDLAKQLTTVKDSQTAKDLVAKFQPLVDQLSHLGTTLSSQKLDTSSLKKAIDDTIARLKDNKEVMNILQPLIDKVRGLMG